MTKLDPRKPWGPVTFPSLSKGHVNSPKGHQFRKIGTKNHSYQSSTFKKPSGIEASQNKTKKNSPELCEKNVWIQIPRFRFFCVCLFSAQNIRGKKSFPTGSYRNSSSSLDLLWHQRRCARQQLVFPQAAAWRSAAYHGNLAGRITPGSKWFWITPISKPWILAIWKGSHNPPSGT